MDKNKKIMIIAGVLGVLTLLLTCCVSTSAVAWLTVNQNEDDKKVSEENVDEDIENEITDIDEESEMSEDYDTEEDITVEDSEDMEATQDSNDTPSTNNVTEDPFTIDDLERSFGALVKPAGYTYGVIDQEIQDELGITENPGYVSPSSVFYKEMTLELFPDSYRGDSMYISVVIDEDNTEFGYILLEYKDDETMRKDLALIESISDGSTSLLINDSVIIILWDDGNNYSLRTKVEESFVKNHGFELVNKY